MSLRCNPKPKFAFIGSGGQSSDGCRLLDNKCRGDRHWDGFTGTIHHNDIFQHYLCRHGLSARSHLFAGVCFTTTHRSSRGDDNFDWLSMMRLAKLPLKIRPRLTARGTAPTGAQASIATAASGIIGIAIWSFFNAFTIAVRWRHTLTGSLWMILRGTGGRLQITQAQAVSATDGQRHH